MVFMRSISLGLALYLLICWLENPVSILVFHQFCTMSFLIPLIANKKSDISKAARQEWMGGRKPRFSPKVLLVKKSQLGDNQSKAGLESAFRTPIHLNRYTHAVLFAFLLAIGYCLGIAEDAWEPLFVNLTCLAGVVLGVVLCYVSRKIRFTLGDFGKIALPLSIILLFGVAVEGTPARWMVLLLAVLFYFFLQAMNLIWLVRTSVVFRLNTVTHVAAGRLPLLLGLVCGILLSILFTQVLSTSVSQVTFGFLQLAIAAALALVVVISYALLPFNHGTPVNEGLIKSDLESLVLDNQEIEDRRSRPFKERCTAFGDEHGLTTREKEVLFLLACGYNSETIARLLIISGSTARTHVYRIFQKIDIHSQQELIQTLRPPRGCP
jgi:DNA-binding CsgD family transcriptional regulator